MAVEQRKFPRIDVSLPLSCHVLHSKDLFYTVSKDLSKGGLKAITYNFYPKNSSLRVSLNIISKIVNIRARVVWCNKERFSDRYSIGLEFIEVAPSDKKDLIEFLEKLEVS